MDQLQTAEADSAFKDYWDNFQLSRSRAVTRPTYTIIIALLPYLTLLVAAILSGLLVWPVYVTGRQLAALSDRFDVVVQPSHPDRCGGLRSWGDFCFNMTLPVVIAGSVLGAPVFS